MSHQRVIPRDLFNESKFLKCLGALWIAIHEKRVNGLNLVYIFEGNEFKIHQNPHDASLWCANIRLYLGGEEIHLFHPYNSKDNYPIMGRFRDEDYYLLDAAGNFMPNFGAV